MEKDKIFFGESGLTSTSANHIANMAKEHVRLLEEELNSVEFVNIEVGLIGSSEVSSIQEGVDNNFLFSIEENLNKIAKAKSLIAWLREAIKARERLLREVDNTDYTQVCNEIPEKPLIEIPMTEDKYLSTLNVKERNRYYFLETMCSTIGKYIHPDGRFAEKRKELNTALKHRHKVSGSGRDSIIYSYSSSISVMDVEEKFFALQAKHREYQAELNSIKYKMEKAITDDTIQKRAVYEEALRKYNAEMSEITAKLVKWKGEESQRISSLKIVIPNDLQDIYQEISALGK